MIDPATGTMYVLTKTGTDDTGLTYLHAFDITTGAGQARQPYPSPGKRPGTGDGSVNGVVSFDGPASSGRFHANDRAGSAVGERHGLYGVRPQLGQLSLPRLGAGLQV